MRLAAWCALAFALHGCASSAGYVALPPQSIAQAQGSYYEVQKGESLWRIARDFGVDVRALAAANRLPDPAKVRVGQRLFVPEPPESSRFLWPARGRISRPRGLVGNPGGLGLQISAPEGSIVRASRTGRVAVAARELAGWGKIVILDHGDGYVTIYAGFDQSLVTPGFEVRQGNPVGRLGSGPLFFEIRYGTHPRDALRLLP